MNIWNKKVNYVWKMVDSRTFKIGMWKTFFDKKVVNFTKNIKK